MFRWIFISTDRVPKNYWNGNWNAKKMELRKPRAFQAVWKRKKWQKRQPNRRSLSHPTTATNEFDWGRKSMSALYTVKLAATNLVTLPLFRSQMSKIAETTHMIASLGRGTKSSNLLQPCRNNLLDGKRKTVNVPDLPTTKQTNKFKTGGIVATAVQPNKKSRKDKHPKLMMPHIRKSKSDTEMDVSNVKDFVKKVRTKIKKSSKTDKN